MELNTFFQKEPGKIIGGQPTYWTESGKYFLYFCPSLGIWVIASGSDFTNPSKIPPRDCSALVRSSNNAPMPIDDPTMALYWTESNGKIWVKTDNVAVTYGCFGTCISVVKRFSSRNKTLLKLLDMVNSDEL